MHGKVVKTRLSRISGCSVRVVLFVVWDNHTTSTHDDRVGSTGYGYTVSVVDSPTEQAHYNAFVEDPQLTGNGVPEAGNTGPSDEVAATRQGIWSSDQLRRDRARRG